MTTLAVLLKAALKELFNNLDHAASHETRDFWVRDEDFAQSFGLNRLHNIYWWVNISTGRTQLLLMPQHVPDLGSADGETQCLSGMVKILGSTRLHLLSGVHVTHTHTHRRKHIRKSSGGTLALRTLLRRCWLRLLLSTCPALLLRHQYHPPFQNVLEGFQTTY